ncbi:tRNA pseudouridine(38-40) synthase TruA [Myroides injenensis]|uniref:tRNA pseudouridine(38-40) synthase TruA n=1 Tax=Myroides injenensis TaxID=1183151 RepID=UPI000288330A|nr:tRNA pseudouridine(38-40) synthase TruA [Myroides injenensis]
MRYFLEFAYNGTQYHGWQLQPNAKTVQETLTNAISTLLRKPIELVGAGRTDAGVHAKQMYAHFDFDEVFDIDSIIQKMNSFLPEDIVVFDIIKVADDAHARFDATDRTYEYHIHLHKDAFCNSLSYYHYRPLDVEKMNEAAKILFEYEDFECFSKTHTDVFTFNCAIYEAEWTFTEPNKLVFTISANRFLRNMVRAIVGTLINVGLGKLSLEDFRKIIESKNRGNAGFSVPGKGLFLTKVSYPYL